MYASTHHHTHPMVSIKWPGLLVSSNCAGILAEMSESSLALVTDYTKMTHDTWSTQVGYIDIMYTSPITTEEERNCSQKNNPSSISKA